MFTARYALSPYITQIHFILKGLNVDRHNYALVKSFVYLESCTKTHNNKLSKILPNAHCSLTAVMKRQMVHKLVIIRLHKTLICMVLVYGCETWRLSTKKKGRPSELFQKEKASIGTGERKNEMWRIRYNEELHTQYKDTDRVSCIKLQRLQ